MTVAVSEGHARDFARDGFVVLDDFFDANELAGVRHCLTATVRAFLNKAEARFPGIAARVAPRQEADAGIACLEAADHAYVAGIYDTIAQSPQMLRLQTSAKMTAAANRLLQRSDEAPLYTFTPRLRIDPPQDDRRTYGWHQEVFYTVPDSHFLQIWAPMIRDSSVINGTIEICRGSHLEGVARATWNEAPGRALQVLVDPEVVAKYPQTPLEMKVGQLLMFSGRTFHRSGSNQSDHVRYSLIGMFHDVDHPGFRPASVNFGFCGTQPADYFKAQMARFDR